MITGMTEQGREMSDNRWDAFSDEELAELRDDVYERSESSLLPPPAARERISRLCAELDLETKHRESEKATYQGPGFYKAGKRHLEVLGTTGDPKVMGVKCQVVMRDKGDSSGILMLEYLHDFNKVDSSGRRTYEYLRQRSTKRPKMLREQLTSEMHRRAAERVTYRGPGIYRAAGNGSEYVVTGLLGDDVVLRRIESDSESLTSMPMDDFNQHTRFTWVREA
jgi:hypothetical protein